MNEALGKFESTVIKELPGKKRDLSTLSKLDEQLKSQKKLSLPPNYEYSKLEEVRIYTYNVEFALVSTLATLTRYL